MGLRPEGLPALTGVPVLLPRRRLLLGRPGSLGLGLHLGGEFRGVDHEADVVALGNPVHPVVGLQGEGELAPLNLG